jgi:hypothetical protein
MDNLGDFVSLVWKSIKRASIARNNIVADSSLDSNEDCWDGEGGVLFSNFTGIVGDMFVDPMRLTVEEVDTLVHLLTDLYRCHGLNPVFHPSVSVINKYIQMRDFCNQRVYPHPTEMVDVEFCDYAANSCPYSETCISPILSRALCSSVKIDYVPSMN